MSSPERAREKSLTQSPKVDYKLVAAHRKLKKELDRLGVDTKTRYSFGIPITEKHRNPVILFHGLRDNTNPSE